METKQALVQLVQRSLKTNGAAYAAMLGVGAGSRGIGCSESGSGDAARYGLCSGGCLRKRSTSKSCWTLSSAGLSATASGSSSLTFATPARSVALDKTWHANTRSTLATLSRTAAVKTPAESPTAGTLPTLALPASCRRSKERRRPASISRLNAVIRPTRTGNGRSRLLSTYSNIV